MNIVFMGTPDFAVPSLRALLDGGYRVAAVVTQPDRPKGRKRVLTPPPVKTEAEKHGIPVLQPEKLRRAEAVEAIEALRPDLIVTAAYGQILPKRILELPVYGCINVHASLLPKYRGGAPIHHAIMNGEQATGVTIMYMAEGLDTGDMISKIELPITDQDDTGTMHDKLMEAGAKLLAETVPKIFAREAAGIPQANDEATYAPNITREDERIDWRRTSRDIFNQIRGLCPWPVAYTLWNDQILKIWACRPSASSNIESASGTAAQAAPGTVLSVMEQGIEVKTGDGSIIVTKLQPAGKKPMTAGEFVRGGSIAQAEILS